jgi:hypothetical protein
MLLRDHPLMSRNGVRNWPPSWSWSDGLESKYPTGEVGILKAVSRALGDRCFLYIHYEGTSYIGRLLFDDLDFCRQVAKLLRGYCDRPIAEIGSLDLSHPL